MKVFLGGTVNGSKWRDILIPKLKIDYFNPVVEDWTPEDQEEEIKQRKLCDFVLYVITPRMSGVYSIAEVVDDSNKRPEKTLLFVASKDKDDELKPLTWEPHQRKSLEQVKKLVKNNGGTVFQSLDEVVDFLNQFSVYSIME